VSLADEILSDKSLAVEIESLELIPGTGGIFEVTVNDDLIFSKKALWRHAKPGEVYNLIKAKVN